MHACIIQGEITTKKILKIDNRELKNGNAKNADMLELFSGIASERDLGIEITIETLPVGDIEYIEMEDDEDITKHVLVERKTLADLLASIEDNRTITQYEGMIEKISESDKTRAFTIIVGTDWEREIFRHSYYKTKRQAAKSIELSMLEILAKYSTAGLNVLQVPRLSSLVELCFKLFNRNLDDTIRHVITVDHSNRRYEKFARSIDNLVKGTGNDRGIGIKNASIIAENFGCYQEIIESDPLTMSNVIRMKKNQKIGRKPIPTVEKLWKACKGIDDE